ncbi:hypothetical protein N1028_02385 [Herbiconiux sp. CPCC 203407]|uniref:Uncharacterized protein n=1 Tax=Herbiconiux oxytropis TaxID=2970915 RepID=A0AA41XAR1_9MICO|nr:hypothetical protein [Herbiconiux oxytropis]MCS5721085.1 hypothetical protein [Herbiconiux oxytropis]MCS5724737.1 hypothetical protein [Herbiconiux oxytropis]
MDISPEVQSLGVSLAGSLARNSAQLVWDRVNALKAKKQDQETLDGLQQIITELIGEKNDLTRIAQAYQAELVAQRLSSGDVQYITQNVLPIIEKFAEQSGNDSARTEQMMGLIEPLLSIEMVNVMQLLGFNFRSAIGEPLTELVSKMIAARAAASSADTTELEMLRTRREIAYLELAQDAEAYERFMRLSGQA